jgi:hypothetical protein
MTTTPPSAGPAEVRPLVSDDAAMIEAIPADARLVWTEPDGLKATHYVPVGKYAHEAAELLRALANDLSRARDAIANCVVDRERLADERRSLAKDAERLELALATERGKLEKADAVADKWARDAARWRKLMQVVRPDDLLPFDSLYSETSWGYVIGYRECWAEFDAAIDRAIEAAGRKEGGGSGQV